MLVCAAVRTSTSCCAGCRRCCHARAVGQRQGFQAHPGGGARHHKQARLSIAVCDQQKIIDVGRNRQLRDRAMQLVNQRGDVEAENSIGELDTGLQLSQPSSGSPGGDGSDSVSMPVATSASASRGGRGATKKRQRVGGPVEVEAHAALEVPMRKARREGHAASVADAAAAPRDDAAAAPRDDAAAAPRDGAAAVPPLVAAPRDDAAAVPPLVASARVNTRPVHRRADAVGSASARASPDSFETCVDSCRFHSTLRLLIVCTLYCSRW